MMMAAAAQEEFGPEDILFGSLQALYDYQPITVTSAGSLYTYTRGHCPSGGDDDLVQQHINITLRTPDTHAANWSLHASAIWVASIYLADHLGRLGLDALIESMGPNRKIQVLELGASAGLPSILISKKYGSHISVTASDYPDEVLLQTLTDNINRNEVSSQCRAIPYGWGSDASCLLREGEGFDVVIAADTIWNPDLHGAFIASLKMTLRRSPSARVHLVAGLHTGLYTIQSFLNLVKESGLEVLYAVKHEVTGSNSKSWSLSEEDAYNDLDQERRRWIIWVEMKWPSQELNNL